MKRYAVIKKIDGMASSATVCREFDNIDDVTHVQELVCSQRNWPLAVLCGGGA